MVNQLPVQLSDASGVPYYRQIMDQVAQFIRSGQLPPDARLPSVRDLAKQLLVSLITVRRSYQDLENAGLIIRRQGYGTYVAKNVQTASREQAMSEAKTTLAEALAKARRLGVGEADVQKMVKELMAREGD